jgi:hypothetical protein
MLRRDYKALYTRRLSSSPAILTEGFCGFPRHFQANIGTVEDKTDLNITTSDVLLTTGVFILIVVIYFLPLPVAAQSKVGRSVAGNSGSNPARRMDVCLCVCMLCCLVSIEAFATS